MYHLQNIFFQLGNHCQYQLASTSDSGIRTAIDRKGPCRRI